jgi:DNA mismatch repair endonuclease MutH
MSPAERRMKDVLRCPEKQDNYDATDIDSIFHYARGIEGKTLLTILQEAGLTEEEIAWVHSKESDKGLPGKIVEASYFGYELNNRQEADFETVGAELKTTAADFDSATSRYKSGETVSVTQIDFRGPVETDFYASHLYDKLKMLIVIFYHRDKTLDSKLLYEVFFASLFRPSEEDLAIIKSDYQEIIQKISAGQAHTLSRSDGTYLSTAPKARRSTNMITPYYGGERIVKRSYTLRKEYVNVILNRYYSRPEPEERLITDIRELARMSFAQIIQSRFAQYLGRDIWDIAGTLNLLAKQTRDAQGSADIPIGAMNKATLPVITARMLGLRSLKSEEFTKAGISVKTVFFNRHGTNKEKFRLGDADFMEIYNAPAPHIEIEIDDAGNEEEVLRTGWEDSELFAQLDSIKYLFVIFQEDADGDIVFKGSKMWAMSDDDIDEARQDWMDIKAVLTHGVQLRRGDDGRTYNNFPGVAEARCIHLRPHGTKSFYVDSDGTSWGNGRISDTEPLPDGRRMTRQSYWLNSGFVREIVRDLIDIE